MDSIVWNNQQTNTIAVHQLRFERASQNLKPTIEIDAAVKLIYLIEYIYALCSIYVDCLGVFFGTYYENLMMKTIKFCRLSLVKLVKLILKCVITHQHTNFESLFELSSSKQSRKKRSNSS